MPSPIRVIAACMMKRSQPTQKCRTPEVYVAPRLFRLGNLDAWRHLVLETLRDHLLLDRADGIVEHQPGLAEREPVVRRPPLHHVDARVTRRGQHLVERVHR